MELPCGCRGLNLEPLEEQWPQLLSHLSFLSQTVFVVPNCPPLSCPQEPCKDMVPVMPLDRTLYPQCLGSASLGELGHYKAFTSVSSQLITLPGIRTRNRTGGGPPPPSMCSSPNNPPVTKKQGSCSQDAGFPPPSAPVLPAPCPPSPSVREHHCPHRSGQTQHGILDAPLPQCPQPFTSSAGPLSLCFPTPAL